MALVNYSHDVAKRKRWRGRPLKKIFMGVELELSDKGFEKNEDDWDCEEEISKDRLRQLDRKIISVVGSDFAVTKPDSSVSDGIEIVSVPASLPYHKFRWRKLFKNLSNGFEAREHCGMHVHLNQRAFTEKQVLDILEFVHTNQDFMKHVGRRYYSEHCDYRNEDIVESGYDVNEACEVLGEKPGERTWLKFLSHGDAAAAKFKHQFVRINWWRYDGPLRLQHCEYRSAKNTIEIRVFRSTTNWSEFCCNIEFCEAISLASMMKKLDPKNHNSLVDFVMKPKMSRRYPNLAKFLRQPVTFEEY